MSAKWSERFLVTRAALQTLISGGQLNFPGFYIINDAVSSTKKVKVEVRSASAISTAAVDLTDDLYGNYNITADTFTPLI